MILFLNDIAGSEILLILVFILIFFGSKSIPGLAKTLGRTIYQIKEATSEIQGEIKKSTGDMKNDLNLKSLMLETEEDIRRPLDQMASDLDNAVKYTPPKVANYSNQNAELAKEIDQKDGSDVSIEVPKVEIAESETNPIKPTSTDKETEA